MERTAIRMDKELRKPAQEKRRGFTLGELLIVVAIIGVLVAVAIPTLNYQLEKAREAVDIAHLRQAKSAAVAYFTTNPPKNRISRKYYDVYSGELVEWVYQEPVEAIPLYGKGTKAKGLGLWTENGLKYNENLDVRDCLIMVTADQDGHICCGWVKPQYAIRSDPFKFLATLIDENGKEILFPTRSKSRTLPRSAEMALTSAQQTQVRQLYALDQDLEKVVQYGDEEEMYKIYYTLEMYYELEQALANHPVIKGDNMLALQIELFFSTRTYSIDTEQSGNNFFKNTIFQKRLNDAEAVTLGTQFWARVAEYNGTNVDAFKIDGVTEATEAYKWYD